MRREGRQHGMVLFYQYFPGPSPELAGQTKKKLINELQSVPTTKCFTKVPAKPTNHSRFTSNSRCHCCHVSSKAKSKTKHSYKRRCFDELLNYRLAAISVIGGHNLAIPLFNSISASHLAEQIDADPEYYLQDGWEDRWGIHSLDGDDDDDDECGDDDSDIGCPSVGSGGWSIQWGDYCGIGCHDDAPLVGGGRGVDFKEDEEAVSEMSFCVVELNRDRDDVEGDEDDGWCLIGD